MGVLRLLAGRYLLGLRRRTHVAAVSAISFGAMALGAMAMVITLALLEGFQATIRTQLVSSGVHALLRPRLGRSLPVGDWLARLRARHPELQVRATASGAVWCLGPDGSVPAELEVVDTLSRVEVNRVLAARLGVGAGAQITVASARSILTPLGPVPVRRRVAVDAVIGVQPADERAVVRLPSALGAQLLPSVAPRTVSLRSSDPALAWGVASVVQDGLPEEVEVVSFAQLNRPLLAALALERAMIGFGVALVMVVAALNLLCNLSLLAAEKRADVALLAACGLPPGRVRRLFLVLGLGVGALGGVLGVGVGSLFAYLADRFQLVPLPSGVFIVSHVPFRTTPGDVLTVLLVCLSAAFLASLPPARAAARRDILEGLRYE
jgi:lipoprotein-releasing system permease protein